MREQWIKKEGRDRKARKKERDIGERKKRETELKKEGERKLQKKKKRECGEERRRETSEKERRSDSGEERRKETALKERRRETEDRNEVIQPIFQQFYSPNIWIRGAIYATLKYITSFITILFNIRIFCYYS